MSYGKVITTIFYGYFGECCEFTSPGGAMIAVFDPATGALEYKQDSRLLATSGAEVTDEDGNIYLDPMTYGAFPALYLNVDETVVESTYYLLKVNSSGEIDTDFNIDIADILPIKSFFSTSFVSDNKIVFSYVDDSWDEGTSWDDRWSMFQANRQLVSVDLSTQEVQPFPGFAGYDDAFYNTTIEGVNYFSSFTEDGWVVTRQNSFDDYSVVTQGLPSGEIPHINKLW